MPPDPDSMPLRPVVAVVGATGAVGEVLLDVLAARSFPVAELRALASRDSVGRSVVFRGREVRVQEATADALAGADLVFFAATGELSHELAPAAVERGARVVDKSATFRLDPEVPLVVPEINGRLVTTDTRLVACPNCTTIGLVMALEPIRRAAGLARVVVTTLQAASGAGRPGLDELREQERAAGSGSDAPRPAVFGAPLHGNAIPVCDALGADGVTLEERKLLLETRRILDLPQLALSATCTRVPVAVGHCASIWLETERPLTPEQASEALAAFPGVRVAGDPFAATPLGVAGTDDVLVARVRQVALGTDVARGLALWQTADNLRKGAATNAVQIAELFLAR